MKKKIEWNGMEDMVLTWITERLCPDEALNGQYSWEGKCWIAHVCSSLDCWIKSFHCVLKKPPLFYGSVDLYTWTLKWWALVKFPLMTVSLVSLFVTFIKSLRSTLVVNYDRLWWSYECKIRATRVKPQAFFRYSLNIQFTERPWTHVYTLITFLLSVFGQMSPVSTNKTFPAPFSSLSPSKLCSLHRHISASMFMPRETGHTFLTLINEALIFVLLLGLLAVGKKNPKGVLLPPSVA